MNEGELDEESDFLRTKWQETIANKNLRSLLNEKNCARKRKRS